jgi:hypothetical protein
MNGVGGMGMMGDTSFNGGGGMGMGGGAGAAPPPPSFSMRAPAAVGAAHVAIQL